MRHTTARPSGHLFDVAKFLLQHMKYDRSVGAKRLAKRQKDGSLAHSTTARHAINAVTVGVLQINWRLMLA